MKILQTTGIIAALGLAGVISTAAYAGTSPTTFKQVGKYKVSHCIPQLPGGKGQKNSSTVQDLKKHGFNLCSKKGERLIDSGVAKLKAPNFDNDKRLIRINYGHLAEYNEPNISYIVVDKNNYVAVLPLDFEFMQESPDYIGEYERTGPGYNIDLTFSRNSNKLCVLPEVGLYSPAFGETVMARNDSETMPCVYLKTNKKGQPYWEWKHTPLREPVL